MSSDTKSQTVCAACHSRLDGPYCAQCGQKADDCRRSIWILLREGFDDVFSHDSRVWRTLAHLTLRPGRAPRQYAHGQRSLYTPPIRLFLVVTFLYLMTLSLTNVLFVAMDVQVMKTEDYSADRARGISVILSDPQQDTMTVIALKFFVPASQVNAPELPERMPESTEAGTESATASLYQGLRRLVADPFLFNTAFNLWLSRALFFLMPLLSVITALFFRGRDALLYDHLILSLYLHSVLFALISLTVVAGQFVSGSWVALAAAIVWNVYFIVSLKNTYRRGWIKTVVSGQVILVLYFFILVFTAILITLGLISSAS